MVDVMVRGGDPVNGGRRHLLAKVGNANSVYGHVMDLGDDPCDSWQPDPAGDYGPDEILVEGGPLIYSGSDTEWDKINNHPLASGGPISHTQWFEIDEGVVDPFFGLLQVFRDDGDWSTGPSDVVQLWSSPGQTYIIGSAVGAPAFESRGTIGYSRIHPMALDSHCDTETRITLEATVDFDVNDIVLPPDGDPYGGASGNAGISYYVSMRCYLAEEGRPIGGVLTDAAIAQYSYTYLWNDGAEIWEIWDPLPGGGANPIENPYASSILNFDLSSYNDRNLRCFDGVLIYAQSRVAATSPFGTPGFSLTLPAWSGSATFTTSAVP